MQKENSEPSFPQPSAAPHPQALLKHPLVVALSALVIGGAAQSLLWSGSISTQVEALDATLVKIDAQIGQLYRRDEARSDLADQAAVWTQRFSQLDRRVEVQLARFAQTSDAIEARLRAVERARQ